jgi:hypothetical protein
VNFTRSFVQSDEQYRGKTAIIITADHGRGDAAAEWHSHSRVAAGSEYVWIAASTPSLALRGDLSDHQIAASMEVTYSAQIAATMAHLLGLNWLSEKPDAAQPLSFVTSTGPH